VQISKQNQPIPYLGGLTSNLGLNNREELDGELREWGWPEMETVGDGAGWEREMKERIERKERKKKGGQPNRSRDKGTSLSVLLC
jgi:hypothetical protein